MRKSILFILSILFVCNIYSQDKKLDDAFLKCMYKHTYLKDTLEASVSEDLMILQIGKNVSKFYSYYTYQFDSLMGTPSGDKEWEKNFNNAMIAWRQHGNMRQFMDSFQKIRATYYAYKNYPNGKTTVTDRISGDHFTYEDSLNAQSWDISDSTKTVLGYDCTKATCNFRGREWTAWFAQDIPVNNGPWKLGGLPGLILEAYDKGNHYYFSAIGIEKTKNEDIVFTKPPKKGKLKRIDRKAFLKAYMNNMKNSMNMSFAESGLNVRDDKTVYMDLIEKDYK